MYRHADLGHSSPVSHGSLAACRRQAAPGGQIRVLQPRTGPRGARPDVRCQASWPVAIESGPFTSRCQVIQLCRLTIGATFSRLLQPRSACWNTLSVQVICRCRSMPPRRTAASSRLREKSPLVATSALRWCQLARSTSAQFQVTTACQWRLARSGTTARLRAEDPATISLELPGGDEHAVGKSGAAAAARPEPPGVISAIPGVTSAFLRERPGILTRAMTGVARSRLPRPDCSAAGLRQLRGKRSRLGSEGQTSAGGRSGTGWI